MRFNESSLILSESCFAINSVFPVAEKYIIIDKIQKNDTVVLVIPIDESAPKVPDIIGNIKTDEIDVLLLFTLSLDINILTPYS